MVLLTSCNRYPISGLAHALDDYNTHYNADRDEELMKMSVKERWESNAKWEAKCKKLLSNIEEQAARLDGTTIPLANDGISEIEPLKMTLVENGLQPTYILNGKFRIDKDIELDVWNDWHAEQLRNGALARVDLASPKVYERGVYDPSKYSMLTQLCAIPVSVENGVILAKAGTIIDIKNATWDIRSERQYCDEYLAASKIWLQPVGIVYK